MKTKPARRTYRAVIRWWEQHRRIRRGTNKRLASFVDAELRWGEEFVDGFESGVEHAMSWGQTDEEFIEGYRFGNEWRRSKGITREQYLAALRRGRVL